MHGMIGMYILLLAPLILMASLFWIRKDTARDTGYYAMENSYTGLRIARMKEQFPVDNCGIKIKVEGYDEGMIFGGKRIKLYIQNNRDKAVTITCGRMSANDIMMYFSFYLEVAGGRSTQAYIIIDPVLLKREGFEEVYSLDLYFNAEDAEGKIFKNEALSFVTVNHGEVGTDPLDKGAVLYDREGIWIGCRKVDADGPFGCTITLYMQNSSDINVNISGDEMYVNGFKVLPYLNVELISGKKAVEEIILDSELKENDIEEIRDIRISFKVKEEDMFERVYASGALYIPIISNIHN